MNRVTPSSKFSAISLDMVRPPRVPTQSDVIDIDDVVDVIVLENDLLVSDFHLRTRRFHRVERRAEIGIDRLVTKTQREPVEPEFDETFALLQDFDIADVVAGARFRQAGGAGALGADTEDAIFQTLFAAVIDE